MSTADDLLTAIRTLSANVTDMAKAKTVAHLNISSIVGSTATVTTNGTRAGWRATLTAWTVTWNDGTSSGGSGIPPTLITHPYSATGTYTAVLTVVDSKGVSAHASRAIPIGTSTTYTLTVVNGSGDGNYVAGQIVTITADPAPTEKAFSQWTGGVVASPSLIVTTVTMPASNLTLTATYIDVPPPDPPTPPNYSLQVVNGSGSGTYTSGAIVSIGAFTAPPGQTFSLWTGATVAAPSSANTTLTMPAATTVVTATYVNLPPPSGAFLLTVTSGTGSGSYAPGATVPITANAAPSGQVFLGWIGSGVVSRVSASTSVIMPASDTTVLAVYQAVGASKSVLQPSDLMYLGMAALPLGTSNHGLGTGALTGRMVGGTTRLTLSGSIPNGGPLYEVTLPAQLAPDFATLQSAPDSHRCTLVNDWGLPSDLATKMFGAVTSNGYYTRGLLHYNGKLFIAFQDKYAGADFPCIIYARPGSDGSPLGTAQGPWPTSAGSKLSGGYMALLPDAFASTYTNGHKIAYGSPYGSVGAASPWGIICLPGAEPTDDQPLSTPIACDPPLAQFGIDTPQPVPTWIRRAICGYDVAGVGATCAMGFFGPTPADGFFGPCDYPVGGATLGDARRNVNVVNDYVFGTVWYSGTKQGVLFFGWLVTDVPGAAAQGRYGTDDKPHAWYHANNTDCHGQTDAQYAGITGPHTPSKRLVMWIYDQADFGKVALGQLALTDLREQSLTPLSVLSGGGILEEPVVGPTGVQSLTNGYIDANNRLYVAENFRDTTTDHYSPLPVIHVFQLP